MSFSFCVAEGVGGRVDLAVADLAAVVAAPVG